MANIVDVIRERVSRCVEAGDCPDDEGGGGLGSPLSVITEPVAQFTGDLVGTGTGAVSDVTGTVTQATTSTTGNLIDGASVLPGIGGISTTTLLLIGLVAFLLLRK